MFLDADIAKMSKAAVTTSIKVFKAQHPGVKINVTGNLPALRQRLQDARDSVQETTLGVREKAEATDASGVSSCAFIASEFSEKVSHVSVGSAVQSSGCAASRRAPLPKARVEGGDLESLFSVQQGPHPLTVWRTMQLRGRFDESYIDCLGNKAEAERLKQMLQPLITLIETLAHTMKDMSRLNSSAQINLTRLCNLVRGHMPNVVTPEVSMPIFKQFGVVPTCGAFEDQHTPLLDLYASQVKSIEHMVQCAIVDWCAGFPPPRTKVWSRDFEASEIAQVKAYIRKYIDEHDHVDPTLHRQSDAKADEVGKELMAMEDFPVPDARNKTVITQAYREVCRNTWRTLPSRISKLQEQSSKHVSARRTKDLQSTADSQPTTDSECTDSESTDSEFSRIN